MADQKDKRFTFDPEKEGAEVPTLTSLLYKKNVVKSGGSGGKPQHSVGANTLKNDGGLQSNILTLEPTTTLDVSVLSLGAAAAPAVVSSSFGGTARPAESAASGTAGQKRIIPAMRAYYDQGAPTVTAPGAYSGNVVAPAGIGYLFDQAKVGSVIVFESKDTDLLIASSQIGTNTERVRVWGGMEFSKKDFSDLWGRLEKYSFAEYSTLGMAGQGNVDRMAFRNAFQAKGSEWLTLIRIRQLAKGDALVAVLSTASIQAFIPNFHSAALGEAKAKAA